MSGHEAQLRGVVDKLLAAVDRHAGASTALKRAARAEAEQARRPAQHAASAALGGLPRPATAGWSDRGVWAANGNGRPATLAGTLDPVAVRVGTLALGDGSNGLPAVLGLIGSGHVAILDEGGTPTSAQLQGIVLRALASAAPGSLELWFVDADGGGRLAAPFARLLAADGRAAAEAVAIDETGITQLLERLNRAVLDVQATVLQGRHSSLSELLAQAGRSPVPRRLLVVSGFPTGFRRESARALGSILRNGAASGVHALIAVDRSAHADDVDVQAVLAGATALTPSGAGQWQTPTLLKCAIALDPAPPPQLLSETVDRLADAVRSAASQSIPLDPTLPPDGTFWKESASNGLQTQIGYTASGDPAVWEVSDRGNPWATFIAGTAGSGKSNLIHTMITGLAARYSPAELEMYLLDCKEGVELWQYGPGAGPHWLPHVKVIGRETDREFGLEALNHLRAELRRRYTAFGDAGLRESSYSAYREAGHRAPRLPRSNNSTSSSRRSQATPAPSSWRSMRRGSGSCTSRRSSSAWAGAAERRASSRRATHCALSPAHAVRWRAWRSRRPTCGRSCRPAGVGGGSHVSRARPTSKTRAGR